ncbi:MAG: response regulator [Acidobacteria bacterium]|nr:MAG: response regulator [Acidobacteriota bacterium]
MPAALKILVVDDNPTVLKLLCQCLENCGDITMASSGADAMQKAVEIQPDLIISDYSMPGMDGQELFEGLRGKNETSQIPFVFLASQKELDERLRVLAEGVEDFLLKPFFVQELSRQVQHIAARLYGKKMENLQSRGGAIAGLLTEMSLIDWMQTLEQGRKTCTLLLRSGADTCKLYFNQGQVTHAECGAVKGNEAVYRVLTWSDGEWEVDFTRTSHEQTTTMSTQALMMEGLRLLDEASRNANQE